MSYNIPIICTGSILHYISMVSSLSIYNYSSMNHYKKYKIGFIENSVKMYVISDCI